MRVGVCITTHNRCSELARTLGELARLDPSPAEVIVVADGCTDGTLELLESPPIPVRTIVHVNSQGSIPSRNEMAQSCSCEVFVSLDDDSYPVEDDFVARIAQLFAERPCLAVASFPQRTDEHPSTLTARGFGPGHFSGSYANSGAAIRTSVFRELGGYPPQFFHAYEEPDFALRCVAAGWQVWHETGLTIRHHFTPSQRNEVRTHHRHARNELWSVLMRCPAPQLIGVAGFRLVRQFQYALKRGVSWALQEPAWWVACVRGVPQCLRERAPMPWARYLGWMRLVAHPIHTESEWTQVFGKDSQ